MVGFDSTSRSAALQPKPLTPAEQRRGRLRLVPDLQARTSTRWNWIGSIGGTLLEMPWPIWGVIDLILLTAGIFFGYEFYVWRLKAEWIQFSWLQTCFVAAPAFLMAGLVFGLYEQQTLLRRSRAVARSILTTLATLAITYLVIYFFMYSTQSRRVLFLAGAVYLLAGPSLRLLVCWCLNSSNRRFLIVGTDRKSRLSPDGLGDGLSRRYKLVGYIATDPIEMGRPINNSRVIGTLDDIERICLEHDVHEVVVGPGPAKHPHTIDRSLACLKLGCRVTNLSTFYEQVLSEVPLAHLEPQWFLFADLKHYREAQLIMKRLFDSTCAIIGLVLTLPFWPLVALLIKLDSHGPVFYSQRRVGLNGKVFKIFKFRTMVQDAEAAGHSWAVRNDPRITRLGWYLRKSRIDELPQLWNILIGQMSVVGPRPERPEFVEELAGTIRFYNERHLIKPGLTGWAQINYPYGASVDDARRKLQLDLWYIKHMSLEQDLAILLRTIGTVCLGSR